MAKRIYCVLLILSLSLNSGNDEIFEGPQNTLTSVGEKTVLSCCFRDGSREPTWSKYKENGHWGKICIKELCPDNNNYKIDHTTDPECYNLLIVSSSKHDSTLYKCNDGNGHTAAGYVATYKCSINISNEDDLVVGDIVTFRCHIMSHNRPKFKAYWKLDNGTIINGIHSYENQHQYESTLTVTAQHPELPPYSWTLKFLISSVGDEQIDMSTPTANWTSKRIKVAYPVTNVRTDCIDGACERVLGDSIRCLADGYPSPDFSWLNEDGVEIGRGPMLKLKSPETQKYKCVAKNLIRGTSYTESVVAKVFIGETERYYDSDTTRYLLYVVILLLVSIGIYKFRSNSKVLTMWRMIKRQFSGNCSKKSSRSIEISLEGEPLQKDEKRVHDPRDNEQLKEKESDNKPKARKSRINPDVKDAFYDNSNNENYQGQVVECQQDAICRANEESPFITAELHIPTEEKITDLPVMEVNLPHH